MEKKRSYRMKERARAQEETRLKIVEATMRLHETVGPRATTISAIAQEAGVQRLTVYRHFPDETAVFQACTSHWLNLNPPPDPESWAGINGPMERVKAAVRAFHAYYAATRDMWMASHRDVADVPALQGPMAEYSSFLSSLADALAGAFGDAPAPHLVHATIRHALSFPAWLDLEERGLKGAEMAELVAAWLAGVLDSPPDTGP